MPAVCSNSEAGRGPVQHERINMNSSPSDTALVITDPQNMMHEIQMFHRTAALSLDGFEGSGADWLEQYKPYINDGETVVVSPHKMYGPQSNDLSLQLRKRGISKVVLAGMSANLCTEAHLRQLLEDGFEVTVVKDATAAGQHPELGDGYAAALVNFGFIANAVVTTKEAVASLN